jgi:arylformamidase
MTLPGFTRSPALLLALLAVLMQSACSQSERRFGDGQASSDGYANETADACADQHRKVSRMMERFGDRALGPAPDRKDIAYGSHARQKLDVFLPSKTAGSNLAPVIVMVHGGGWCVGDKTLKSVTTNKVKHWVPRGFMLVSVNYPMLTDGRNAAAQAEEVARAIAHVQQNARSWGGDERRIVLMGHSAGAHLVSLVNADAQLRARAGVKPVLGTVSIDSGATNTVVQMQGLKAPKIKERYVEAFGSTEEGWKQVSPWHKLDRTASPWLGICSSKRADDPCSQARAYADKSMSLGVRAVVLPFNKSHGALNSELGEQGSYTAGVDEFIGTLEPSLRGLLAGR